MKTPVKGQPFRQGVPWPYLLIGFGVGVLVTTLFGHGSTTSPAAPRIDVSKLDSAIVDASYPLTFRNRRKEFVTAKFPVKLNILEMNVTTKYMSNGHEEEQNLFLMGSNTNPPFIATLAHPKLEAASSDVYEHDDMEIATRHLFEYLLNFACKKKTQDGRRPLVVDAGSNLGYFATYSGAMGCEVVAFEPQPRLIPIISTSVLVNDLSERFTLLNNIISDNAGDRLKITYVKSACWGCSTVTKAEPSDVSTDNVHIIESTRIDQHVDSDVLLMKVDVEGFEVIAIESAKKVFEKHTVHNLLIEWMPARWPHPMERGTKLLEWFAEQGYVVRHYDLRFGVPLEYCEPMEHLDGDRLLHRTWPIKREYLGKMNEDLMRRNGEANLWLSKR